MRCKRWVFGALIVVASVFLGGCVSDDTGEPAGGDGTSQRGVFTGLVEVYKNGKRAAYAVHDRQDGTLHHWMVSDADPAWAFPFVIKTGDEVKKIGIDPGGPMTKDEFCAWYEALPAPAKLPVPIRLVEINSANANSICD